MCVWQPVWLSSKLAFYQQQQQQRPNRERERKENKNKTETIKSQTPILFLLPVDDYDQREVALVVSSYQIATNKFWFPADALCQAHWDLTNYCGFKGLWKPISVLLPLSGRNFSVTCTNLNKLLSCQPLLLLLLYLLMVMKLRVSFKAKIQLIWILPIKWEKNAIGFNWLSKQ